MSVDFAADRARLLAVLLQVLPPADAHPQRLHAVMHYAVEGGKRLRALLVYATARCLGLGLERVDGSATAVELIHAYSLVHDDLPAMDDDDLRRGRPTVHRAFDEATAVLVGDALGTLAFEVLAADNTVPADLRAALVVTLARASGSRGMVGGQALDLDAERRRERPLQLADLQDLHRRKTGALIEACIALPLQIAAPPAAVQQALETCGRALGLAYQVQDDVLDVEMSSQTLGKTAGKDAVHGKLTYVSLLGLETAKQQAAELFCEARTALAALDEPAPLLAVIALVEGRQH
jgi:geranylgeranyl pyrophosphate synthase